MRFWIRCTRSETGQPIHINIALVGSMSARRRANRARLRRRRGQTIEVAETPERIMDMHLGPLGQG